VTEQTYIPDPRRWKALAVCFMGGFVGMLDVSIVNVAMPSIQSALSAGATQLQLIVAGYTLAFGLFLVPSGRLGDASGRRRMFIIAMAGFAVMSLLAGLAQTDTQLAVFRLLQGGFAGMSNPQVSGMIQQLFRGRERAKAFGFFGGVIGVSTALGPLLGGAIIALAGPANGWRWVFFINVPIIAVVLPLARRLLPGPPSKLPLSRLDGVGLVLIALGTATFMAPFVTTPDTGFFDDPQRWFWLVPAFVLLPATFFWERHYQRKYHAAVLNPGLLRTPSFVFGAALGAAWFAGFTALMLVLTLMLQTGLAYTALLAGLVGLPNAIASAVTSATSGRLVPRFGRKLVIVGILVYLVGLVGVILVMRQTPQGAIGWALAAVLFVMGVSGGWVIAPNQSLTYQDVPPRYGSVAGAVMQVGQRMGTAVGMSVVLAVYLSAFSSQVAVVGKAEAARQAGANALVISACIVVVALLVAILDAVRRGARKAEPSPR